EDALALEGGLGGRGGWGMNRRNRQLGLERLDAEMKKDGGGPRGGGFQGGVGGGFPPMAPGAGLPRGAALPKARADSAAPTGGEQSGGQGAQPVRVRELFPETMLWRPALITDAEGVAKLPIDFADSITTWRLTASASSRGGLLGGVEAPLKVFQDFFVDLDLPVALTQNDEVAFPVAVYNYLDR